MSVALRNDSFQLILEGAKLVAEILLRESVLLRLVLEAVLRAFELLCVVRLDQFRLEVVKINSSRGNLQDERGVESTEGLNLVRGGSQIDESETVGFQVCSAHWARQLIPTEVFRRTIVTQDMRALSGIDTVGMGEL